MRKEDLLNDLTQTIEKSNDHEIFQWFVKLNKKYKKQKKEGKIDDAAMLELTDFWLMLREELGEEFIFWLEDMWDGYVPAMVRDIMEFTERYSELACEKELSRLDRFERKETELLFNAIWERNVRTDIACEIYDWDTDEIISPSLTIKRKPRTDNDKYMLKRVCAMTIYNRGILLARFYSDRGRFDVAGIMVPGGTGEWEPMSKEMVADCYEGGLESNETAIILEHGENSEKTEADTKNILYFAAK